MKKVLKLILLLSLSDITVSAQVNYIFNPSFEDKDDQDKPNGDAQVEFLQIWQDQIDINNNCNETCCDGVCVWGDCYGTVILPTNLHSPDWFCSGQPFIKIIEGYGNTSINGYSGSCYIGMSSGELIQQDFQSFFSDDRFVEGNEYALSMYIRIPAEINTMIGKGISVPTSGTATLKAYVNHDKLNYSVAANNPCNFYENGSFNFCNNAIFEKKSGDSNPTEIMSIQVNSSIFTTGSWHKITSVFPAPILPQFLSDIKNDWLTIELQGCNLYVLIDEISLARVCEIGCENTASCSTTDEPFNPIVVNQTITTNSAVKITNLHNVTSAFMKISTFPGGTTVFVNTVTCNDGIKGPIYWRGADNYGGQLAAAGTPYLLDLYLTNDCGTCRYTNTVIKNQFYYGSEVDFQCNNCNVITPEPCCCAQPDINLSYITICGPSPPGGFLFQATHNINIGPNVIISGDADVTFYAGNEIVGTSPHDVAASGSHVIIGEVVPCPTCRLSNPDLLLHSQNYSFQDDLVQNSVLKDLLMPLNKEIVSNFQETIFSIIPNPSQSGIFNFLFQNQSVDFEDLDISVFNVLGEKVVNITKTEYFQPFSIDISKHPKGVYFVKINTSGKISVQKIVYQ